MPHLPPSGAAMDTRVPRSRRKLVVASLAGMLLLAALAAAGWWAMPRGLQVPVAELRIGTATRGIFLDEVVVRASAEPLHSVLLDSVESGRIEEVLASDGALVSKGQLLFRISNPQRNLELLARKAEHAQQIFNLSNLRVAQQASASEHQRRLDDLAFAQQQRALAQEQQAAQAESLVRRDAASQLGASIAGLSSGLLLVGATVDALAVRAPSAGRLTDFRLQVGESIATGKNVGRIDDPVRYKLSARVDEFYLNRMAAGRQASIVQAGQHYALRVQTIYPQIKEGRFTVELVFTHGQPPVLNPGQSLDAQITLGEPAAALLLPNGAFINDSGGAWVYVLDASGGQAQRRAVRIGRRNNSQLEVLQGLQAGERVILSAYAAYGNSPRLQISR